MADGALPFGNTQESGNQELAGAPPVAINVLVDGRGAVRRRPGLVAYDEAPTASIDPLGIKGLHVTTRDTLLAVGGGRHLFQLAGGAYVDRSASSLTETILGTGRPVFAENEVAVIVAGGDLLQKIDLATLASTRLGAASTDAPPASTHVIAHNQRLLANDIAQPTRVVYSRTGQVDYDEWPDRYILTAEAKPDPVRAVYENINEVWAFGVTTTQLYVPDPSSVYAPSKTLRRGIGAPYSVIEADEQFAWLDQRKRFILSDGRSQTDISAPIARTLDGITTWDDCFGYRWVADQFDCLVWTFPTDGRSFCFQLGGGWSQWHGRSGSNWTLFPVSAHFARESDGVDVVGLTDGRVCQLSATANTDLGDPIVAEVTTGYQNRGTDAMKECLGIYLTIKPADGLTCFLSWRDDDGPFEDPIPVEIEAGDKTVTVEVTSLGSYRRREWKLTFSGGDEWVLAGATERFNVVAA